MHPLNHTMNMKLLKIQLVQEIRFNQAHGNHIINNNNTRINNNK